MLIRKFLFCLLSFLFIPLIGQHDTLNLPLNDAFAYYKTVLAKNSTSVYANYGLAKCYYLAGDYRSAIKICKKQAGKKSEYKTDVAILYAMSLIASGQSEKAITLLSSTLEVVTDNCEIYYYKALAEYKLLDFPRAFESAKKCIALKDAFYPAHLLLGFIMYERNNNRFTEAPLYYALYLNPRAEWAPGLIFIIHSLLDQKHERITIPIRDKRYAIKNVEDIVKIYYEGPYYDKWSFDPTSFVGLSAEFISSSTTAPEKLLPLNYSRYYMRLDNSKHTAAFCYVILESMKNAEVIDWYKSNSKELTDFADWIEKENL